MRSPRHDGRLCCYDLPYLAVTNTFAVLRLLPMSDRDKDTENRANWIIDL